MITKLEQVSHTKEQVDALIEREQQSRGSGKQFVWNKKKCLAKGSVK